MKLFLVICFVMAVAFFAGKTIAATLPAWIGIPVIAAVVVWVWVKTD